MKIFFRKKFTALFTALIMALCLMLPVDASAAPVILGLSSSEIKVGDSFSVSIAGASSSNLSLHYDGTMVTLTGQGGAALNGNTLTISAKSATFTFTAKQEGNAGFVASSDQYERSSAVVKIAQASAQTSDNTQAATADNDTEAAASDNPDTTDDSQTKVSSQSASDSADTHTSEDLQTDSEDTTVTRKHGVSSQDLTFSQLITDRRMIIVIAVLLAVIIVLIIRLTTLHYAMSDDYDDDIDFDEEEKRIAEKEEEQRKLVEHVTEKKEKSEKLERAEKTSGLDLDGIDVEKLTMPKAPKNPNKKLKLEDLNDL